MSEKNITIGEFDIIGESNNKTYHVEAAVKFYLGLPQENNQNTQHSSWNQWVGPNNNDRLDIKMRRLINHQLMLSNTKAGLTTLEQLKVKTDSIEKILQLQGYLFYPDHDDLAPPEGINSKSPKGKWYYHRNFNPLLRQHPTKQWLIPDKKHWLSPLISDGTTLQSSRDIVMTLNTHFQNNNRARPILLTRMEQKNNQWLENERLFVVPDNWPW